MNWDEVVAKIQPYVVRVETPDGSGTGFLCMYNHDKSFCGIATASHVVSGADRWQQPIRLVHYSSQKERLFKEADRIIFDDKATDSAVVLLPFPAEFPFPKEIVKLLPVETPLSVGREVGWLGFPAIELETLCFFSGTVSAWHEKQNTYLIDGVAINGVSGGPVLCVSPTDGVQIVGIVSAYRPNRIRGDALPGLIYAQDVSHFHGVIDTIKSLDEANAQKREAESKSKPETN